MRLEVMRMIAERRSKGELYDDSRDQLEFLKMVDRKIDKLLALAERVKNSPCRHSSDVDFLTCPVCIAVRELEQD